MWFHKARTMRGDFAFRILKTRIIIRNKCESPREHPVILLYTFFAVLFIVISSLQFSDDAL